MLITGTGSDLVLYGREEKAIKCHQFMITARCPQMLREVIQEEIGSRDRGRLKRQVVPLIDFSHQVVKSFVWYLYTGIVDNSGEQNIVSELKELGRMYGLDIRHNKSERSKIQLDNRNPSESTLTLQSNPDLNLKIASGITGKCDKETREENEWKSSKSESSFSQKLSPVSPAINFATSNPNTVFNPGNDLVSKEKIDSDELDLEDQMSTHSSVDLFEDLEREINAREALKQNSASKSDHVCSELQLEESVIELDQTNTEEEDYMNELASPVVSRGSQSQSQSRISVGEKRSRSVSLSPLVHECSGLYDATQVANLLQKCQDGRCEIEELCGRSNKKQRLSSPNTKTATHVDFKCVDNETDFDMNLELKEYPDCVALRECTTEKCDSVDHDFEILFESEPPLKETIAQTHNLPVLSITPKKKKSSVRLSRSSSTPNISATPKLSTKFSYNNFDEDDSIFANIPDDVFAYASNNRITQAKDNRKSQCDSSTTPIIPPDISSRSRGSRRLSPRRLLSPSSSLSPDHEDPVTAPAAAKKKRGKKTDASATQKSKTKTSQSQAKLKLPKKLKPTTVPADTFRDSPVPVPSKSTKSGFGNLTGNKAKDSAVNKASPSLNYSLIDTPILKVLN